MADDDAIHLMLTRMVENAELLGGSGELNELLGRLAQRTRELSNADYAAISVFEDDGSIARFVHTGMEPQLAARLGSLPLGRGLLGALAKAERPIRLDDLRADGRFTGWPAGHPDMGPFVGVPIRAGGRNIGSLYMTRDIGAEPFNERDELGAVFLSLQAAAGVAAALAQQRRGRVLLLEERVAIAHDLHDGTIQSLYALGLELDLAAQQDGLSDELQQVFASATQQVNAVIGDIRSYISSLEARNTAAQPELSRDLAASIRQIVPDGVDVIINISAPWLEELSARDCDDLLYIAREALSNAVRHSGATKIALDLRQTDGETALTIQDNGIGFTPSAVRSGLGSVTIRTRAERIGGEVSLVSIPGMGTTIRISVPREECDD